MHSIHVKTIFNKIILNALACNNSIFKNYVRNLFKSLFLKLKEYFSSILIYRAD